MADKDWLKQRLAEVKADPQNPRRLMAQDPVSAYVHLLTRVHAPGSAKDGHPAARQRAVYRGHRNKEWRLEPTAMRLGEAERAKKLSETRLFADIVNTEFESIRTADTITEWPEVSPDPGLAAARHHGFDTSLLDWSALPLIAMDFATSDATDGNGTLWWVYWSDLKTLGVKPHITLPFLTRLYRQRGLFTEIETEKHRDALEAIAYRIDFPITGHLKATAFNAAGNAIPYALYPSEAWYLALKNWVQSDASAPAAHEESPALRSMAFDLHLLAHGADDLSLARQFENDPGLSTALGCDGRYPSIVRLLAALCARGSAKSTLGFDGEVAELLQVELPGLLDWARQQIIADPDVLNRHIPWLDDGLLLPA
jgi:hypothetical protein